MVGYIPPSLRVEDEKIMQQRQGNARRDAADIGKKPEGKGE
jgi:hypothetical protein